ncbi:MAG: GNAT family N-acetyltransferase [Clostridiales bacterium]|nr:GNAT family N-acetyltransferase [Clostridiales bacterium]
MDVTYRDFEEADFSELSGMIVCLYEEDPEGQPINSSKIRATVCESLAHPEKLRITMICADETVIGYSISVFFWSNEYGGDILHIDELYVKKEYRNSGIASDFIRYQMDANENAAAFAVEATPSNIGAARLYTRLGFEPSPNSPMFLLSIK